MTDNQIIDEAVRLVRDGVSVTLPVDGRSMLPFIVGGRESIVLQSPEGVKVGDVVLAWVEGGRWVVHRIIRIDGDYITLMGDGNLVGTEHCAVSDVKAIATHVVDIKGRMHQMDYWLRRLAARLWWYLRPVRRYLLGIYKLRINN